MSKAKSIKSPKSSIKSPKGEYDTLWKPCSDPPLSIFHGTKSFWRSRMNIDVDIFYHKTLNCVEVIGFDPVKHSEAPRIFIDSVLLFSKIDVDDVHVKMKPVLEQASRNKHTMTPDELDLAEDNAIHALGSLYVENRLAVDLTQSSTASSVASIGGGNGTQPVGEDTSSSYIDESNSHGVKPVISRWSLFIQPNMNDKVVYGNRNNGNSNGESQEGTSGNDSGVDSGSSDKGVIDIVIVKPRGLKPQSLVDEDYHREYCV